MSIVGTRSTFRDIMSGLFNVVSTVSPRVRAASVETPEAYSKWGAPGDFPFDDKSVAYTIDTKNYDPLQGDLYEEGCRYSDIRVQDPEDENQSVVVRRYDAVAFRARPKPFHPADQTNIYPQVMMTFSNFEGGKTYASSEGKSFKPVALDPFNTIVGVSWASIDYITLVVTISPIKVAEIALETDDQDMTARKGEFIKDVSSGVKEKGESDGLSIFQFNGRYIEGSDVPISYPSCTSTSNPACFSVQEIHSNNAESTVTYWWKHPTNSNVIALAFSQNAIQPGGMYYGTHDDALYETFKIHAYNDGDNLDGSDDEYSKHEFWRNYMLVSLTNEFGYPSEYALYLKYYTPWKVKYDPSPYKYAIFRIDVRKMRSIFFELNPDASEDQFDTRLVLKAHGTDIREQWEHEATMPTYTGYGTIRATWYKGGSETKTALDQLGNLVPSGYVSQATFMNTVHYGQSIESDNTISTVDGLNIPASDTTISTLVLDHTNKTVGAA